MPTVDIDRDAAHDAAQRELSRPIYPRQSFSDRFGDWLDQVLYDIVSRGSEVPGGWFTLTVLAILIVLAVVVAIRIARRTMRTDRRPQYELFDSTELSAAQHRQTAEQYAAGGDWSTAIRHRLRAVARHLEETGALTPVAGRTSTELARAGGVALPDLAQEFLDAATIFNDVTYGERPGSAAGYHAVSALDERLRTHTAPVEAR